MLPASFRFGNPCKGNKSGASDCALCSSALARHAEIQGTSQSCVGIFRPARRQYGRMKSEYDNLRWEPERPAPSHPRTPAASGTPSRWAQSRSTKAAVLALKTFREHDCTPRPGAHLDIEVKSPSVRDTLKAGMIEEWLTGGARSPGGAREKRRLPALLDA